MIRVNSCDINLERCRKMVNTQRLLGIESEDVIVSPDVKYLRSVEEGMKRVYIIETLHVIASTQGAVISCDEDVESNEISIAIHRKDHSLGKITLENCDRFCGDRMITVDSTKELHIKSKCLDNLEIAEVLKLDSIWFDEETDYGVYIIDFYSEDTGYDDYCEISMHFKNEEGYGNWAETKIRVGHTYMFLLSGGKMFIHMMQGGINNSLNRSTTDMEGIKECICEKLGFTYLSYKEIIDRKLKFREYQIVLECSTHAGIYPTKLTKQSSGIFYLNDNNELVFDSESALQQLFNTSEEVLNYNGALLPISMLEGN